MAFKVDTFTGHNSATAQVVSGLPFTPVGIHIFSFRDASWGVSNVNDARLVLAASDGTRRWSLDYYAEDLQGTTDTRQTLASDEFIALSGTTSNTRTDVAEISFGVNAFTINWAAANASVWAYIIWDSAHQIHVGTFDVPAAGGTFDVTDPGFQPSLLMTFGGLLNVTEGVRSGINMFMGAATASQQMCSAMHDADGVGTHTARRSWTQAACIYQISTTALMKASLSAFLPTGFRISVGTAPAADTRVAYIAISRVICNLAVPEGRDSAGSQAYTGVGFPPELLWMFGDLVTTASEDVVAANSRWSVGVGDGTNQYGGGTNGNDGGASSVNNHSSGNEVWREIGSGTGGGTFQRATLTSLDADGWTLNFSDATSGNRQRIALSMKEDTSPPPSAGSGRNVFAIAA